MNEQKHAWLVMKYQFSSGGEYRIPIYRIRRERTYRKYFRMRMSGRAMEEVFQFHRPFRGKSAFKMSAYRPKNVLVDESPTSLDQPDKAIDALWAAEAENRMDAYDRGEIKSISVHEVMAQDEMNP